jgi:hypothetical protein
MIKVINFYTVWQLCHLNTSDFSFKWENLLSIGKTFFSLKKEEIIDGFGAKLDGHSIFIYKFNGKLFLQIDNQERCPFSDVKVIYQKDNFKRLLFLKTENRELKISYRICTFLYFESDTSFISDETEDFGYYLNELSKSIEKSNFFVENVMTRW